MYCQKCGTKNTQAAKFCKNCGQPLGNAQVIVAKQPVVNQPKSAVRTQASGAMAPTRTQTSAHEWVWFNGGTLKFNLMKQKK